MIFLLQDVFQTARDAYPEEIGVTEISEKTGIPKRHLDQTIRKFYNKYYQKHPEKYPITIEKKSIRPRNSYGIVKVWRVKWRPEDVRGALHGD